MSRSINVKLLAKLLFLIFSTISSFSQELKFTEAVYNDWINMRIGDGISPVYYQGEAEIYSYPEGELLAKSIGVDMGFKIAVTPDSTLQLSRKIFLYIDAESGEILESFGEKKVKHILFPYQMISYVRDNEKIRTWAVQGSGNKIRTIGPGIKLTARENGNTIIYTAPMFINRVNTESTYQIYENYDFIYSPDAKSNQDKYQITWSRFGYLPSFLGEGRSMSHRISRRLDNFEELDPRLKTYILNHAPLWKKPPMSLQEIKDLQENKIKY